MTEQIQLHGAAGMNDVEQQGQQQAADDGGDQETEQQEQQSTVDTDDMTEQIPLHGVQV